MSDQFEPKIALFACNWCTYAALDLAGTSRMKYPPNFRVIRVMCSSRIDPQFIVEAFRDGADGVLVAGCHLGDCHYIDGNYKALRSLSPPLRFEDRAKFPPVHPAWCDQSEERSLALLCGPLLACWSQR